MRDRYDAIYLSPHLDDVVLSCGGQIFQRTRAGQSVLVLTTMAPETIPPPPSEHAAIFLKRCGLEKGGGLTRRREDEAACRRLGAESIHDGLWEGASRRDASGAALYPTHASMFGAVRADDDPLREKLVARLAGLPPTGAMIAPLGVGGHVDHQLVRQAAEQVFGTALRYYEDYPYANKFGAVRPYVQPRREWAAERIRLDREAFQARYEAVMSYASQVGLLFNGAHTVRWKLRAYIWRVGGERLWRKRVPAA